MALKVFEELDFIRDEHGKISFGSLQKNDLAEFADVQGIAGRGTGGFCKLSEKYTDQSGGDHWAVAGKQIQ